MISSSVLTRLVEVLNLPAGGPGCSSELAVFYENGPYHIKKDLTLTPNPFGWDAAGSIIFVDQVGHMLCRMNPCNIFVSLFNL